MTPRRIRAAAIARKALRRTLAQRNVLETEAAGPLQPLLSSEPAQGVDDEWRMTIAHFVASSDTEWTARTH